METSDTSRRAASSLIGRLAVGVIVVAILVAPFLFEGLGVA
jgi:hypothetical protein